MSLILDGTNGLILPSALGTANGGTGLSSFTSGGVVYASSTSALATGSALTFDGTTLANSTSGTPLSLNRTGAGTALIELKQSGTVGSYLGTSGASDMIFFNGSAAELMRLNGTGLGIGTSSPAANRRLDAVLSANVSAGIRVQNTNTGTAATCNTAYLAGGNTVEVGVIGSNYTAYGVLVPNAAYTYVNNSPVTLAADGTGYITFGTGSGIPERARIDSSGNLLMGATASGQPDANYFMARNASGFQANIGHATGTASGQPFVYMVYGGVAIGSITQSGTTAVLYNLTSDQRLKENIANAESSSDLIDAIQVRQYNWKSDGSFQRYGFIAQELVTVAPEAVHQPADPEEMMAVDYSKLVPMLVKEIQSLRQRLSAANL